MAHDLAEQISKLRKQKWVNLQGLIDCSTAHLSGAGSCPSCLSISLLGRGSFNSVYGLVFSDGTQLAASVSNHDEEDFNAQAKQSEIETMAFVRESGLYPDIPVPKVHAWDTTFNNPACAPYVLMDVVQGVNLADLKDDNRLRGLDTLPHSQQLSIVKALAKLKASLSKPVPLDELGSITAGAAGGGHSVGPLMTLTQKCLGGPFKSAHELWRSRLEHGMLHAVQNWCNVKEDRLPASFSEPNCTPQTFSELFQLLSSLIPHFRIPRAYSSLVLHHPDFALRNIFFDKESLSSDQPKITGVIDWGGAQILPLMLTAWYPDDIMTTSNDPFTRPGYPGENWHSVPSDWTSIGDTAQWPQAFYGPDNPVDYTPRVCGMVRRFYLRTYFSACYAEQLHLLHEEGRNDPPHNALGNNGHKHRPTSDDGHVDTLLRKFQEDRISDRKEISELFRKEGVQISEATVARRLRTLGIAKGPAPTKGHSDAVLTHATLFADAPYYLKFHETVCGGWASWVRHASWIRETYWRLRTLPGQGTGEESLIIGPNVYRASVEPVVRDLGVFEDSPCSGNPDDSEE